MATGFLTNRVNTSEVQICFENLCKSLISAIYFQHKWCFHFPKERVMSSVSQSQMTSSFPRYDVMSKEQIRSHSLQVVLPQITNGGQMWLTRLVLEKKNTYIAHSHKLWGFVLEILVSFHLCWSSQKIGLESRSAPR